MAKASLMALGSALFLQMIAWGFLLWYPIALLILSIVAFASGKTGGVPFGIVLIVVAALTALCGWLLSLASRYLLQGSRPVTTIFGLLGGGAGLLYGIIAFFIPGGNMRAMCISYGIVLVTWSAGLVYLAFRRVADGQST